MIVSHRDGMEKEPLEAAIVEAVNAVSGSPSGARRESLEEYLVGPHPLLGVYELRVIFKPGHIDDHRATRLAPIVAKKFDEGRYDLEGGKASDDPPDASRRLSQVIAWQKADGPTLPHQAAGLIRRLYLIGHFLLGFDGCAVRSPTPPRSCVVGGGGKRS